MLMCTAIQGPLRLESSAGVASCRVTTPHGGVEWRTHWGVRLGEWGLPGEEFPPWHTGFVGSVALGSGGKCVWDSGVGGVVFLRRDELACPRSCNAELSRTLTPIRPRVTRFQSPIGGCRVSNWRRGVELNGFYLGCFSLRPGSENGMSERSLVSPFHVLLRRSLLVRASSAGEEREVLNAMEAYQFSERSQGVSIVQEMSSFRFPNGLSIFSIRLLSLCILLSAFASILSEHALAIEPSSRRHHRRLFEKPVDASAEEVEEENDLKRMNPKGKRIRLFENWSRNSNGDTIPNDVGNKKLNQEEDLLMNSIRKAKLEAEALFNSVNKNLAKAFSWTPEEPKTKFFNLKMNTMPQTPRAIYVNQSTVLNAGKLFLSTIFMFIFFKWFISMARRYNWGWSESNSYKSTRTVRDRSLGGKEITISKGFWPFRNEENSSRYNKSKSPRSPFAIQNPLDVGLSSREESKLLGSMNDRDSANSRSRSLRNSLPEWWKQTNPIYVKEFQNGNKEVQFLLNYLLNLQLNGQDFPHLGIYELYSLCRNQKAFPSFSSNNTRDSVFRSAIQMAFLVCSKGLIQVPELTVANVRSFLVNFSLILKLDAQKTCSMIHGAIAAKIRSVVLQAYASLKQNKPDDAMQELTILSKILSTFPLDINSPEMDMLTYSLSPRLTILERSDMLSRYISVGGNSTQEIIRQALGLNE